MTLTAPPTRAQLDDLAARGAEHRFVLARLLIVAVGAGTTAAVGGRPVAVLAVAALLVGVVVVARPDVAALVAVALVFSNAPVIAVHEHGVPGALAALVPLLLLLTTAHRAFALRQPILLPRASVWLVLFLVVQIVGSVASRDPVASVASVQAFLLEGLLLFVLVANAIRGWELVRLAAIVLVVVAGVLGALSLVQEVTGTDGQDFGGFASVSNAVVGETEVDDGSVRHAGPIGEQNRWAQSLAVVLPLGVALAAADRSRAVRLGARAAVVGVVAGIVLTYSRGAVVGLVLAGAVAVLLRWIRPVTAVAVAVGAALLLATVAPVFTARASTVVSARSSVGGSTTQGADGSFVNRSTEATAAFAVFVRHPAVGVGSGLFRTYFQDEARAQGADRIVGVDREAHNLYLGLAAETGALGLASFGAVMGALLGPLARVRRRHRHGRPDVAALATGFALSLVTYLATGLFLHLAYVRYLWLVAALAAAMGMVADQPAPAGAPRPPTTRTPSLQEAP